MEVTSGQQKPEDKAQMSHYVVDKVKANRAGIKNLFQGPDGPSIWGAGGIELCQHERALARSRHMTTTAGPITSHKAFSSSNFYSTYGAFR